MSCISVTSWWNISCLTCKTTHGFCFSQFYNLKQFKIEAWIAEFYMFYRCLLLSMWSTVVQTYTQRINSPAAFESKEPPPDCSLFGTGGVEWVSHGQEFPRLRGIFDGGAPHHEPVCGKDWRRSFCDIFGAFNTVGISTEFLTRAQFRWFSQLFNRLADHRTRWPGQCHGTLLEPFERSLESFGGVKLRTVEGVANFDHCLFERFETMFFDTNFV